MALTVALVCLAFTKNAGALTLDLPPVSLIPPLITGVPVVGQPLNCSQGTWTGPPTSYAYQWTRAGSDIAGAGVSGYTVVPDDAGKALRCRVMASNSMGSASATSLPVLALGIGVAPPPGAPTPAPTVRPPLPGAREVVTLPANRRCVSRRRFRIRIRKIPGVTLAAVAIYVAGKPVKVVRGARVTARVDLRGLPSGTFSVRIEAATTDGRTLKHSRKYRTCEPRRSSGRRHRL